MNDLLYKGHFKGLDIAFTYTVATTAVNESVVRHDCDPAGAHILGRATGAGLLAAALLPEGRRLNACWKYEGGLKTVVVDAGSDGTVRSLISPNHLGEFENAHEALYGEQGQLQVITTENGSIVNSGTTPIPFRDTVNDLAYHFSMSDQIETGMCVMIGFQPNPEQPVALCQGWMIQALPNTDLERFERILFHMGNFGFRDLLGHESAADSYFEQIANTLVGDEPGYKGIHMEALPAPRFKCTCNREKMYAVLRSIPIPDRMTMVKRKEPVGISCRFCNKRYNMTINECIVAWNQKVG